MLAKWLQASSEFAILLQKSRVLEIGSGLGVCGLLVARMCCSLEGGGCGNGEEFEHKCRRQVTASSVTLSDLVPEVLDNLKQAVALNGVSHVARVVLLDWARDTGQMGVSSASKWYAGDMEGDEER